MTSSSVRELPKRSLLAPFRDEQPVVPSMPATRETKFGERIKRRIAELSGTFTVALAMSSHFRAYAKRIDGTRVEILVSTKQQCHASAAARRAVGDIEGLEIADMGGSPQRLADIFAYAEGSAPGQTMAVDHLKERGGAAHSR